MAWTCPDCRRTFGTKRGHTCLAVVPLEQWLDARPHLDAPTIEAFVAALEALGPVIVEPAEIGLICKRGRTFAELRPKGRAGAPRLELCLVLDHPLSHPRLRRTQAYGERSVVYLDLRGPDDLEDEELQDWLAEAYDSCPP
jgi:hypothetical protein